ncbi:MAG: hydantoinase/oxoprolinase family protein [Acidobacteriota bacterium]|nr:hydantoinase/oxoprolinase family protein [Acidobacteriota bacterium]
MPTSKTAKRNSEPVRVGVDTGGTFTDFVFQKNNRLHIFKLASTPGDPSRAIAEGLRRIAGETGARVREIEVAHGTTVGTNALLERRGARAGLVTTAGFEDVLEIGRQARPSLYDLDGEKPPPLVPRRLRLGVRERVAASGEVLEKLDEADLRKLVVQLKRARVESVAVSLLFSFVRPEHERKIKKALAALGVPLSISHEILPEYREYERTSTVVINAYLQPLMGAYLGRLGREAPGLRVMQSSGGSVSARVAAGEPVRTILSGPAGGVVGALRAARQAQAADVLTFDMGGTSTDVALCAAGETRTTNEATISGMPIAIPVLDIHTVGAGGGSVARVDAGGALRVGPESAGAEPGPACYGRGGALPTVTDANLVLGRFGGGQLLGGDFGLDAGRARDVLTQLAREMSAAGGRRVSAIEAALGVVRVVNAGMERALRAVSIERGYDPRGFTLVSFGGAGGLHAVALAQSLRIPRVVVPRDPGALSALGALASDVIKDSSRTVMLTVADGGKGDGGSGDDLAKLERAWVEMERAARTALHREGFANDKQQHERSVAARYKGQSFELEITAHKGGALVAAFHRAHLARYGYAREENAVEIVSARLRSLGLVAKLQARRAKQPGRSSAPLAAPPHGSEKVYLTKQAATVAVYRRDDLTPGAQLKTPCIVIEYSSTTLVPSSGVAAAQLDHHGNLIIML